VGFGISTPDQAAAISRFADGIIVGSAIIDAVDKGDDKTTAAALFVKNLYQGLDKNIS
jgi:tryptophan synthase alpha chain